MQPENKKIILASYLIIGILAWFILKSFLASVIELVKIHNIYIANIAITNFISVGFCIVIVYLLFKNEGINVFASEVISELKKVTWPTKKETSGSTFVVVILVLIAMFVLGIFDLIWVKLIQLLL